jgi:hypothetical protein
VVRQVDETAAPVTGTDDELMAGPDRPPRQLFPIWSQVLIAVVVLAVLGALALNRSDPPAPPPLPAPTSSTSTPTPTSAPTAALVQNGTGPLSVGAVCVHTDGSRLLRVQFQMINTGVARVTVTGVSSYLPVGGLRPVSVTLPRSPSCGTPAARTGPSTVLEPGERIGAQLAFRLPAECPTPYPVQADVDVLVAGENPGTQRLALLNDLGGYEQFFTRCGGQSPR